MQSNLYSFCTLWKCKHTYIHMLILFGSNLKYYEFKNLNIAIVITAIQLNVLAFILDNF